MHRAHKYFVKKNTKSQAPNYIFTVKGDNYFKNKHYLFNIPMKKIHKRMHLEFMKSRNTMFNMESDTAAQDEIKILSLILHSKVPILTIQVQYTNIGLPTFKTLCVI